MACLSRSVARCDVPAHAPQFSLARYSLLAAGGGASHDPTVEDPGGMRRSSAGDAISSDVRRVSSGRPSIARTWRDAGGSVDDAFSSKFAAMRLFLGTGMSSGDRWSLAGFWRGDVAGLGRQSSPLSATPLPAGGGFSAVAPMPVIVLFFITRKRQVL